VYHLLSLYSSGNRVLETIVLDV